MAESISFNQNPYQLTRIAPTPSGYIHFGNVFSFAITAALAKATGAKILLRIDDLDGQRTNERYIEDIFDTLSFLDIKWQMGPRSPEEHKIYWSQRGRQPLYEKALSQLLASGKIFACRCSRSVQKKFAASGCAGDCKNKKISFDESGVSWRLITDDSAVSMNAWSGPVAKQILPRSMKEFIVRRRDGIPAYNLCSVVDDEHFRTDLIVRGADLFDSTVAQLFLAKQLGYQFFGATTFVHHKLLFSQAGTKLSKTAGDTSVRHLRDKGADPSEIYGMAGALAGLTNLSHWSAINATGMIFDSGR